MDDSFHQKSKKWEREERSRVRADVRAAIRYFCSVENKEIEVQVSVSDISEKGAALISHKKEIPVGTEVHATLQLPGIESGLPITIVGQVRRMQSLGGSKYQIGIEFINLSEESRIAIRKFIATQQLEEFF